MDKGNRTRNDKWTSLIFFIAATGIIMAGPNIFADTQSCMSLSEKEAKMDKIASNDLLDGFDENSTSQHAQNDLLKGFEDSSGGDTVNPLPQASEPDRFDLDGHLRIGSSYSFAHQNPTVIGDFTYIDDYAYPDWRGISSLRPELFLNLNGRLSESMRLNFGIRGWYDFVYDLKGMDQFQYTSINERSKYEIEIQEANLYAKVNSKVDLKIGRQIVTWGKADFLTVTNLLNPSDLQIPGTPNEGRLPVIMSRLDFFNGSWNLTGIIIHEKRFHKLPVYGMEFWPYPGTLNYKKPKNTIENIEYAFALNYRKSEFDISFYYADIFDNMPYLEPVTDDGSINYKNITHTKIQMAGTALSFPFLNTIILKGEAAYTDGLKYIANPFIPPVGLAINAADESYARVDGLVACEYTGLTNTIIMGEFLVNYKLDGYQALIIDADESETKAKHQNAFDLGWSVGLNRSFLRNTFNIRLGLLSFQQNNADIMIQTLIAFYDLTDSIKITSALILYDINAESDFIRSELSNNDRVYVEVKYSF